MATEAPAQEEKKADIRLEGQQATDVKDIQNIRLDCLEIAIENVRKALEDDETSVADLAQDIASHGLLHPLTVKQRGGDEKYTIIAGQRRFLALKTLGRETAPCRVVLVSDVVAEEISLTENVQRAQLTNADKVRTYGRLYEIYGRDIDKLSRMVSVTAATLRKYIKIAALPEEVLNKLDQKGDGKLTLETACELVKLKDNPGRLREAADEITRLTTNASRAEAIKTIVANPGGDIALIIDHQSTLQLKKTKLAPAYPWITGHDGECVRIPPSLYETILDLIDEENRAHH